MRWFVLVCFLTHSYGILRGKVSRKSKAFKSSLECPPVSTQPAPCPNEPEVLCGYVMRPLDSSGEVSRTLPVYYRHRLRKDKQAPSLGTLVGMTGGPGYGSTATAPEYESLWGYPLLHTHDSVTVDQRGTGCSGVIDCPSVQLTSLLTTQNVSECARVLTSKKTDLYGMQQAASDIIAVLDFLSITHKVDLYGESYGTFAVQAFAGNFPSRVRSIVVDGAYSVLSLDPWLPGIISDTNAAFQYVCKRSNRDCEMSFLDLLIPFLTSLREQPSSGPLVYRGKDQPPSPLTPTDLAFVMTTAGLNPLVYTELSAALAAVKGGFSEALVRMTNAAYLYYEGGAGSDVVEYSMGMLVATFCQDSPQVMNMSLDVAQRNLSDIIARKVKNDPNLYFPFTIQEWVSVPLDYSYVALCEQWPIGFSSSFHPPNMPIPSQTLPDVPVLVLTGDLDSITPICQGDQCASDYKNAQRIVVPNGVHVVALEGSECMARVVRDFIKQGGPVNASCTETAYAPLRLVDMFASSMLQVRPATRLSGNADLIELRAAAAAIYTAADAVNHNYYYAESEEGLYGGYWNSSAAVIRMYGLRWTSDLALSGTMILHDDFSVEGNVSLAGAVEGLITLKWSINQNVNATIEGVISDLDVNATMRPF